MKATQALQALETLQARETRATMDLDPYSPAHQCRRNVLCTINVRRHLPRIPVPPHLFGPHSIIDEKACMDYASSYVAPTVYYNCDEPFYVQVVQWQGLHSYTVFLNAAESFQLCAVQFRTSEIEFDGTNIANSIHPDRVPKMRYFGRYGGLFVYMSERCNGSPCDLLLRYFPLYSNWAMCRLNTVKDLALFLINKPREITDVVPKPTPYDYEGICDRAKQWASAYPFTDATTSENVNRCVDYITPRIVYLKTLPYALTHQDLTPSNCLVDHALGGINAVLGWREAVYEPVGSNFHFLELFLPNTNKKFVKNEFRNSVDAGFREQVNNILSRFGYVAVYPNWLEAQKAVGLLKYCMDRQQRLGDAWSETELTLRLRGLNFLGQLD